MNVQTRIKPNGVAAPVRGPIKLPRARRLGLYGAMLGAWSTGVVWLVLHDFVKVQGDFGPEVSPAEPWALKLHGAAAFACLWFFGLLWGAHVLNGWTVRRRRWSGGALFGLALLLIVSGYLLYYGSSETVRGVTALTHWAVGLGAPALFLWHRFLAKDR